MVPTPNGPHERALTVCAPKSGGATPTWLNEDKGGVLSPEILCGSRRLLGQAGCGGIGSSHTLSLRLCRMHRSPRSHSVRHTNTHPTLISPRRCPTPKTHLCRTLGSTRNCPVRYTNTPNTHLPSEMPHTSNTSSSDTRIPSEPSRPTLNHTPNTHLHSEQPIAACASTPTSAARTPSEPTRSWDDRRRTRHSHHHLRTGGGADGVGGGSRPLGAPSNDSIEPRAR